MSSPKSMEGGGNTKRKRSDEGEGEDVRVGAGAGGRGNPLDTPDIVRLVVSYCPDKSFAFVAGISKTFGRMWGEAGRGRLTRMVDRYTTPRQLHYSFKHLGLEPDADVPRASARAGNLRCLVVAVGEGCTVDQSVGEAAARAGRVEVLDWVWRNYGSSVEWREPKICVEAAKSGNIDTFKWCRVRKLVCFNDVCSAAAGAGDLEMLKLTVETDCHLMGGNIDVYCSAASGRHAHVLRWLSECEVSKFKWDEQAAFDTALQQYIADTDDKAAFYREVLDICETASISYIQMRRIAGLGVDHLDMLEANLVRLEGYPNTNNEEYPYERRRDVVNSALASGSLETFDFLVEKGFPVDESQVLSICLACGHMDLLRTLMERDGRRWSEGSHTQGFLKAAHEDRLEDLEACMAQPGHSFRWDSVFGGRLCARAAYGGALRVLKVGLVKTSKTHLSDDICSSAVKSGKLDIVKVAVEGGAPLSPSCIIEVGCLDILKYLVAVGCPTPGFDETYPIVSCAEGQLDVIKYLVSSKIVEVSPTLVERVMCLSDEMYEIVEWCLGVCGDEFRDQALTEAAENMDPDVLNLLYTRVDEERWKRVYPTMLGSAHCEEVTEWILTTKTW